MLCPLPAWAGPRGWVSCGLWCLGSCLGPSCHSPCPYPHHPRLTMMQLGLLMDHRLTRQSSPPVARSRPEALPNTSEDTLLAWATISSTGKRREKAVRGYRWSTWRRGGSAWPPAMEPEAQIAQILVILVLPRSLLSFSFYAH